MARPDFFGRASECTAKAASSHINTSGDILLRQSCETILEQGENGEGRKGTMVHGPSGIAMTTARSKSNQGAAKVPCRSGTPVHLDMREEGSER